MSVTIELTKEQERRLLEFARRQGLDPAVLARTLVTDQIPDLPTENEFLRRQQVLQELLEESERLGLYE